MLGDIARSYDTGVGKGWEGGAGEREERGVGGSGEGVGSGGGGTQANNALLWRSTLVGLSIHDESP